LPSGAFAGCPFSWIGPAVTILWPTALLVFPFFPGSPLEPAEPATADRDLAVSPNGGAVTEATSNPAIKKFSVFLSIRLVVVRPKS